MPPWYHGFKQPCEHDKVWLSVLMPMEKLGETLQNNNITDILKRAREQSYVKRLSAEQEREVKDIGGILVPNAFQVPNEVVDEGWLRDLRGGELKVLIFIIRKTFGFNKIGGDRIPFSQIIRWTQLSRQKSDEK